MFSILSCWEIKILGTVDLSSANALNLPCPKICCLTELKPITRQQNFGSDQIESICRWQIKLNVTKMIISVFDRVKNIVEKGEIACTSNFSFSHNVFKRLLFQMHQKVSLCGNGLKQCSILNLVIKRVPIFQILLSAQHQHPFYLA